MSVVRFVIVETSPVGVSLAWGPLSESEVDNWVRDRKLSKPDWTFAINSLHTPIGSAAWREQMGSEWRR
jgi:hypothetical protein